MPAMIMIWRYATILATPRTPRSPTNRCRTATNFRDYNHINSTESRGPSFWQEGMGGLVICFNHRLVQLIQLSSRRSKHHLFILVQGKENLANLQAERFTASSALGNSFIIA